MADWNRPDPQIAPVILSDIVLPPRAETLYPEVEIPPSEWLAASARSRVFECHSARSPDKIDRWPAPQVVFRRSRHRNRRLSLPAARPFERPPLPPQAHSWTPPPRWETS